MIFDDIWGGERAPTDACLEAFLEDQHKMMLAPDVSHSHPLISIEFIDTRLRYIAFTSFVLFEQALM